MVLEEYIVIVRNQHGRGKRQFTYYADPKKKPNAESVLKDFRIDSQIENEKDYRLCTLSGHEIRWLTDYADRILVLEPLISNSNEALLPKLGMASSTKLVLNYPSGDGGNHSESENTRTPAISNGKNIEAAQSLERRRPRPQQRSESSSIASISSTPKLPSLSTGSSSSGSNLLSSSGGSGGGGGAKRNKETEQRLSRITTNVLPKTKDSRQGLVERDNRNGKNGYTGNKRRERSR